MQNKIMKLLLAMIATVSVGIAVFFTLTIEVPVLKTSITAGTVITPDNLTNRRVIKTSVTNAVKDDKYVVGKVSSIDIPANTPFPMTALDTYSEPAADNSDHVTISVPVDYLHCVNGIKSGDLVNIIAFFGKEAVDGEGAFTIGINTIGTIVHVTYESGYLAKVDVELPKEDAVRTITAISVGETYIVKNFDMNDVNLQGITARDLFLENFLATSDDNSVVEDNNGNPLVNLVNDFNEQNGIGGGN